MAASAPPSGDRVPQRPTRLIAALAGLTLVFGISAAWLAVRLRAEPLPILGALPAFSLEAHDGRRVSLESLRGRVWIADFIFTRCGGVCPAMTTRMSSLREEVSDDLRFVSFSVDPGYDTPQVLAAYAKNLEPGDQWVFLTGPQPAVYSLATDGFHLAAMEVPPDQQIEGGDGPFLHSSRFVLVDREGRLRGYYDSTDPEAMKKLVADVGRVE